MWRDAAAWIRATRSTRSRSRSAAAVGQRVSLLHLYHSLLAKLLLCCPPAVPCATVRTCCGASTTWWRRALDSPHDIIVNDIGILCLTFVSWTCCIRSYSADLLRRIGDMVETGLEARDYSWLVRALDQLKVARGVLSNSYAFAYFFFGGELGSEDGGRGCAWKVEGCGAGFGKARGEGGGGEGEGDYVDVQLAPWTDGHGERVCTGGFAASAGRLWRFLKVLAG